MNSSQIEIESLLSNKNFEEKDKELILKSYLFAQKAHHSQKRKSGEDYIQHPLQVGKILIGWGLDSQTVAAAILHDVPEDTQTDLKEIQKNFGKEIARLVDGVTKLGQVRLRKNFFFTQVKKVEGLEKQTENLRKMILAMSKDIRIIFIKLADRLHNMRTLWAIEPQKRKRIALETLKIYAPIANRLEMGELKGELEDLAFPHAYPDQYQNLLKIAKSKYSARKKYVEQAIKIIKKCLINESIKIADIHGRAKHWYSLYQKLNKYDYDFSKIYDLVAVRIIVPTVADCYKTLGTIHQHWKPLRGRIKDYIAMPKPNGYQSLHTTIFCEDGKILEIQIRTPQMHHEAEFGLAAHWYYTEAGKKSKHFITKTTWLKNLAKLQRRLKDPKEFNQAVKTDFFSDRIFILTPKGEIKNLPAGSTPIDFAYSIHSEIGHRCRGAKVNGRIASLNTKLDNGDVVEIITSKKDKKPNYDWLEFVKSSNARYHIRKNIKKEGRPL